MGAKAEAIGFAEQLGYPSEEGQMITCIAAWIA
jgi:hypothetical protein